MNAPKHLSLGRFASSASFDVASASSSVAVEVEAVAAAIAHDPDDEIVIGLKPWILVRDANPLPLFLMCDLGILGT